MPDDQKQPERTTDEPDASEPKDERPVQNATVGLDPIETSLDFDTEKET
jgi:hypothetical protein